MGTAGAFRTPSEQPGPFPRIRKAAKRSRRRIGRRLGFLPPLADRGCIIFATPRSGRNYFCELLASTNMLGNPLEFLSVVGGRRYAILIGHPNRAGNLKSFDRRARPSIWGCHATSAACGRPGRGFDGPYRAGADRPSGGDGDHQRDAKSED
jgi:hypothetical protein